MNQKESPDSCAGILIGIIVGVFAGYHVYGMVAKVVGPTDPKTEVLFSGFAAIITWCICVWIAGNIADGTFTSKFNQSKRPEANPFNIHYTNSKGKKQSLFASQNQVKIDGNKVIIERTHLGKIILNQSQIINPEVLGLTEKETPLPAPQKLPKPINIEEGPPILEPEEFIVGDMSGTELLYTRSDGGRGVIYFDPKSVELTENRAVISPYGTDDEYAILLEKITNPEVLHQPAEDRSVTENDGEKPFLEPQAFILGDDTGKELLYMRHDGSRGVIYFDEQSLEISGNRVSLMPKGLEVRYTFALDKIINPEVVQIGDEEDDEPPILEPAEFIVGDMSGKELLYLRNDGNQGVIYFDPESVEITDTRAIVSPYGTSEEYAILLEKILNPKVLSPQPQTPVVPLPEPLTPVVPVPPVVPPQFETGVRVIIEEVPLDSYESAQIMRRLKPDLGPFEVLEALKYDHETILQGYDELRARDIKTDLEDAGCTVNLQTIDESGVAPAVMEPAVIVETEALPEPWATPEIITEPTPQTARPPTEEEFGRIRWADFEEVGLNSMEKAPQIAVFNFDEVKALIESAPVDVNARDKSGIPLVFGVQSPRILGLLMDRGADIHAKGLHERSILHASEFLNPDVCKMLIQFGADIDARSEQGQTPLICAARSGGYEVAKILIESGADIHVSPEHGRTALEEARDHRFYGVSAWEGKLRDGCAKIAALLHEQGAS